MVMAVSLTVFGGMRPQGDSAAAEDSITLQGTGATFPAPLYQGGSPNTTSRILKCRSTIRRSAAAPA